MLPDPSKPKRYIVLSPSEHTDQVADAIKSVEERFRGYSISYQINRLTFKGLRFKNAYLSHGEHVPAVIDLFVSGANGSVYAVTAAHTLYSYETLDRESRNGRRNCHYSDTRDFAITTTGGPQIEFTSACYSVYRTFETPDYDAEPLPPESHDGHNTDNENAAVPLGQKEGENDLTESTAKDLGLIRLPAETFGDINKTYESFKADVSRTESPGRLPIDSIYSVQSEWEFENLLHPEGETEQEFYMGETALDRIRNFFTADQPHLRSEDCLALVSEEL